MCTSFRLIPALGRQLEADEEKLIRLTEEQSRLLEYLEDHDRCLIEGVAGSGKTLLAVQQIERFAKEGKRTLFVCFNKALCHWVRDHIDQSLKEHCHIFNFYFLLHFRSTN